MIKHSLSELGRKPLALWILLILFFVMWTEVFFLTQESDLVYLFLSLIWYWTCKHYKISFSTTVMAGLLFLVIIPLLMLFKENFAMKAGIWTFALLLVGLFLSGFEEK